MNQDELELMELYNRYSDYYELHRLHLTHKQKTTLNQLWAEFSKKAREKGYDPYRLSRKWANNE